MPINDNSMRVLMIARKTLYSSPGGDTMQMEMTAGYLRKLGVSIDIRLSGEVIDYSKYQLMHFFNIIRPDDILAHIRKSSLPFVVSTVYVDYSEYEKKNRTGIFKLITKIFTGDQLEYLKVIARRIKNGDKINSSYFFFAGQRNSIRYITKRAKMLLPNSHNEYKRFAGHYKVIAPYRKINNAIDNHVFSDDVEPNNDFKDHILCVGRIEGRKNQLNLIKALYDTDLRLSIIGKPSPNHLSYYNECCELVTGNSNMQIIEHIDHKGLSAMYKAAKVHVLPSWFETTGLSSLEAGVMDCNIVISPKGDTIEYFEDMAYYCQPDDIDSIRDAVIKAYSNPVNRNLKPFILNNYTWDKTALQTLEVYELILS